MVRYLLCAVCDAAARLTCAQMSVVHYGVTKAATYTEPLGSKEQLLLVTGM